MLFDHAYAFVGEGPHLKWEQMLYCFTLPNFNLLLISSLMLLLNLLR